MLNTAGQVAGALHRTRGRGDRAEAMYREALARVEMDGPSLQLAGPVTINRNTQHGAGER